MDTANSHIQKSTFSNLPKKDLKMMSDTVQIKNKSEDKKISYNVDPEPSLFDEKKEENFFGTTNFQDFYLKDKSNEEALVFPSSTDYQWPHQHSRKNGHLSSRKKSKRKNHKHHLSIAEILLTSVNDPQSPDIQGHGNKNSNTNKNIPLRRNRNYKNLSIVQQESISFPPCEEQMFRNEYPCYENYRNEEKRYLDQYHNRSYPFGYKRPIPERNMPCLNYVHNDIVSIPAAHVHQSVSTISIQPNEKRQQNKHVKDLHHIQ